MTPRLHSPRSRLTYAAACVTTIALGLASRRFGASLPDVVRLYAGDALWAATVYFLAATLWPGNPESVNGLADVLSRSGRAAEAIVQSLLKGAA